MPELSFRLAWELLACFCIGSIPFAVIAMTGSGIDIRKVGSGNPGFNNVLRVSKRRAIICLVGDVGKGIAAVSLFWQPGDPWQWAWWMGIAVVLGHCYSPFLKFRGGKGIATSAGVMLVLYPKLAWPCIVTYVVGRIVGAKLKIPEAGALSSLSSWALFAILVASFEGSAPAAYAAALFAFVTWRHRDNLARLRMALQH